ncbi:MAG: hypothetical protein HRU20_21510 [Pseudomonadales bacterium]|nr:hypothetical protein [Pseudomonadales bacterium]
MNFLCPKHQYELAQLSSDEMLKKWSEWMTNATFYLDLQQWRDAASYMGCAFELSCLALINNKGSVSVSAKNMTLSAVGLSHCLLQLQAFDKNEQLITMAQHQLLRAWPRYSDNAVFSEYLRILMDESLHMAFFCRDHPVELLTPRTTLRAKTAAVVEGDLGRQADYRPQARVQTKKMAIKKAGLLAKLKWQGRTTEVDAAVFMH